MSFWKFSSSPLLTTPSINSFNCALEKSFTLFTTNEGNFTLFKYILLTGFRGFCAGAVDNDLLSAESSTFTCSELKAINFLCDELKSKYFRGTLK